jgi:hypothetical protein
VVWGAGPQQIAALRGEFPTAWHIDVGNLLQLSTLPRNPVERCRRGWVTVTRTSGAFPMRTVVDSNFLQSDGLRAYLSKSPANIAVLTDYAAMEAHKADTLETLYRSMAILGEFPRQVIVLKGTQAVCGLSGRASGLQRRMIHQEQTQGFAEYCRHLAAARRGDLSIQAQLIELAREARHQMKRILGDMQEFTGAVEDLAGTFNTNEIQIIFRPRVVRSMTIFAARALIVIGPSRRSLPNIENCVVRSPLAARN